METTKNSQKWQLNQGIMRKEIPPFELSEYSLFIASKGLYSYILCSFVISFLDFMGNWLAVIILPSAVWLTGLLFWRMRQMGTRSISKPSVTGITVARNESATIRACLDSLLRQEPKLDEVLMYDDSSSDGTQDIASEISLRNPELAIISLAEEVRIASPKKRALADGFARATGDVVAITDADCVVPPAWVNEMIGEMDPATGAVIGASWPANGKTFSERAYRWERLTANTLMASACGWGLPASACGHSIVYLKKALQEVDAPVHREIPSGDDDLTVQAIASFGWNVKFCASPDSVVRDLGGLRGSRWNQAARHQSVTHLYPMRWRVMFALSIAANILFLLAFLSVPFVGNKISVSLILLCKLALDGLAGIILANKLKLNIGSAEIFAASLVLPVWTFWRALAAVFGKRYDWRGRSMNYEAVLIPTPGGHGS